MSLGKMRVTFSFRKKGVLTKYMWNYDITLALIYFAFFCC